MKTFYSEIEPQESGFKQPGECDRPYSISQINAIVGDKVESGNSIVWFEGEISNFKRHTSGHCYLSLKDANSQISGVIWRSNVDKLKAMPDNGMEVNGIASVRVYRKGGTYQLDIHRLQPSGLGALSIAYEALKRRLEGEGLFAPEHKKALPRTVMSLGVVTSRTGAALRDIIRVVHTRAPHTDIVLVNVPVQGEGAAPRIAEAIRLLNEQGVVECIIVGRGGGSMEDLWAFNEEVVARAIYDSEIPVISAVGHETDFTIADFVADQRAATPSAAAEMAVADAQENQRYFQTRAKQFLGGFLRYFQESRLGFEDQIDRSGLKQALTLVAQSRKTLADLQQRQYRGVGLFLQTCANRFSARAAHLSALSPLAVLSRGYAVVSRSADQVVVRKSSDVKAGEAIDIRLGEGRITAQVTGSISQ